MLSGRGRDGWRRAGWPEEAARNEWGHMGGAKVGRTETNGGRECGPEMDGAPKVG